jgi:hypothetical protein
MAGMSPTSQVFLRHDEGAIAWMDGTGLNHPGNDSLPVSPAPCGDMDTGRGVGKASRGIAHSHATDHRPRPRFDDVLKYSLRPVA